MDLALHGIGDEAAPIVRHAIDPCNQRGGKGDGDP